MNDKIMTQTCDKVMSGDFSTELSMPDYEPEVRRLLRVGVTLAPVSGFCDGGRVGMRGEIIYDILYSGNDGGLYSARASENYELAEALKQSEKCAEELVIICEATPESLISRALAPRKISLKCKLRGRARGFAERELAERSTYIENPESVERLMGERECALIHPTRIGEVTLAEDFEAELPAGASGELRVISYNGSAVVSEVEAARDEALVKGVLYLDLLVALDDAEAAPFKLSRKIPFSEAIDAEGLTPSCRAMARAVCVGADISVDENRIFCEPTLSIAVDAEEEGAIEYTRDLYSTEVASEITTARYEFPVFEKSVLGSVSVSAREALERVGLESGDEVIDVYASASAKSVDSAGERWALLGELAFNFLVKTGGEYGVRELKLPFKYEFDGCESGAYFSDFGVVACSPRAKLDAEKISCDCEVSLCGRICSRGELTAVDEAIFGEPIRNDGLLRVCFPPAADTLWDVAKRYHKTVDSIVSQNADSLASSSPTTPVRKPILISSEVTNLDFI